MNYLSSGRSPKKLVTVVASGEGNRPFVSFHKGWSSVAGKSMTLEAFGLSCSGCVGFQPSMVSALEQGFNED